MKQDFRWPENAQFWPFNIRTFWWMSLVNTHSVEVSSLYFMSAEGSFICWAVLPFGVVGGAPPGWKCRGFFLFQVSLNPSCSVLSPSGASAESQIQRSLLGHLTCAHLDSLAWVYLLSWMMPEWVGAKKPVVWLNKITAACPVCIVLSVGAFQPVIRGLTASLGWM